MLIVYVEAALNDLDTVMNFGDAERGTFMDVWKQVCVEE